MIDDDTTRAGPSTGGAQVNDAAGRPDRATRTNPVPDEEHARQFVLSSSRALVGALALGVLLTLIGHYVVATSFEVWDVLALLATAVLTIEAWLDHRLGATVAAAVRIRRQLWVIGTVSVCCGAAAAAHAASGVLSVQFLVLAFLLAVAAGATIDSAFHRLSVVLWPLPLMLPTCVVLVRRGSVLELLFALALLLELLFVLRRGYLANRYLSASLRYRMENDRLVEQLRDQMAVALQASEEKTRFIAAAAHDLRQPLHALGMFASSVEQRLRDSGERPLIKNMLRATEALEQSFAAILDISRLDSRSVKPNIQDFSVRDLFRLIYLQFAGDAEQRGIALRFRAAGRMIRSDPKLLERALANLVQNALRYTKEGGVLVAARRGAGGRVRLEVRDSGIGIAEDQRELIFREFYQVENPERDRARGLGMGLAIVRRICDLLGHELQLASRPGCGSTFRLLVPAVEAGVPSELQLDADTLPPRAARRLTLLLIDDEQAIRESMTEFLAPQQIQVLAVATIQEALDHARQPGVQIDVIVSDLRLRAGEDGVQAIRQLRAILGAGTPAVLMTGESSPDRLREAHESGVVVLYKPVSARQFLDMIDRLPV